MNETAIDLIVRIVNRRATIEVKELVNELLYHRRTISWSDQILNAIRDKRIKGIRVETPGSVSLILTTINANIEVL